MPTTQGTKREGEEAGEQGGQGTTPTKTIRPKVEKQYPNLRPPQAQDPTRIQAQFFTLAVECRKELLCLVN